MSKYAVGIDFGTLSARALIADVDTGYEIASYTMDYAHAVMDEALPDGTPLPPDWALQHPQDYIDCLKVVVRGALKEGGLSPEDIVGVGIDFTASTVIPVTDDLTPLCLLPEYASRPHAYVKLWKHHGGLNEANYMTEVALSRGETFLDNYGGKVSSEWSMPKILQILNEDPEIYDKTACFIEAGDWIVALLTGKFTRSGSIAGYKAFWNKETGFPPQEYLTALDPRLHNLTSEKLGGPIAGIASRAGVITEEGAQLIGLLPGTAVGVANADAHVALPAAGITEPGTLLMIMGTSGCHIILSEEAHTVPGICGVVADGVVPGLMAYEAGQSCMGDHYNWFAGHCVPEEYEKEAREKGMNVHQLLTEKAARLKPGESGLLALDWWNGNRSVLVDADLSGMMLGMTLLTKPEEIYRALIEGTAYGTRMIIEHFEKYGVAVPQLVACGGIAQKNPLLMQIYADVTGREIRISRSSQAPALGSAILGAVAAGSIGGGYDTIQEAARHMSGLLPQVYRPAPDAQKTYELLYREYETLHDYFGRGENDVMKRLRRIRSEAR